MKNIESNLTKSTYLLFCKLSKGRQNIVILKYRTPFFVHLEVCMYAHFSLPLTPSLKTTQHVHLFSYYFLYSSLRCRGAKRGGARAPLLHFILWPRTCLKNRGTFYSWTKAMYYHILPIANITALPSQNYPVALLLICG